MKGKIERERRRVSEREKKSVRVREESGNGRGTTSDVARFARYGLARETLSSVGWPE